MTAAGALALALAVGDHRLGAPEPERAALHAALDSLRPADRRLEGEPVLVPLGADAPPLPLVRLPPTTSEEWTRWSGGRDFFVTGDGGASSPHRFVRLTYDLYVGATEVTGRQWRAVMGSLPPLRRGSSPADLDAPVTSVSFTEVEAFLQRLSERVPPPRAGYVFRTPTEAEWEYAARAARSVLTPADRAREAWAGGQRAARPVPARSANAWGLHDMLGNVFEWTADEWPGEDEVRQGDPARVFTNPVGGGDRRNARGGAWYSDEHVRSFSWRSTGYGCDHRGDHIGLRVVAAPPLSALQRAPRDAPRQPKAQLLSAVPRALVKDAERCDLPGFEVERATVLREWSGTLALEVCYAIPGTAARQFSVLTLLDGENTGKWGYTPRRVAAGRGCVEIEVASSVREPYRSDALRVDLDDSDCQATFRFEKTWSQ